MCTKYRVLDIKGVADQFLQLVIDVGAVYTEYLSSIEKWIIEKGKARELALTDFKVIFLLKMVDQYRLTAKLLHHSY